MSACGDVGSAFAPPPPTVSARYPAQNERPPSTIAAAALPSLLRSARSTRRRHHRSPRPLVQLNREVVPDGIPVHMPATLDVQRRTARSRQRASCPAGSSPKVPHTNVSPAIPSNSISSPHAQRSQQRIAVEHHTPLHPAIAVTSVNSACTRRERRANLRSSACCRGRHICFGQLQPEQVVRQRRDHVERDARGGDRACVESAEQPAEGREAERRRPHQRLA